MNALCKVFRSAQSMEDLSALSHPRIASGASQDPFAVSLPVFHFQSHVGYNDNSLIYHN